MEFNDMNIIKLINIRCLFVLLFIAGFIFPSCKKTPVYVWYVEPQYEKAWTRIIHDVTPPVNFKEIRVWDTSGVQAEIQAASGILITSKPWKNNDKVSVYYNLTYDLEYNGAILIALDPWMVFRRSNSPILNSERAYSPNKGDGILLLPGKDSSAVNAWIARLLQSSPGQFPIDIKPWQDQEMNLFSGSRFPDGAGTYTWQDVFFKLMGNETAWLYAPLSAIRRYPNPRKSILDVSPFPEKPDSHEYSLQASLLWALPLDSKDERIAETMKWLKKPETQTIIANAIDWIPADPYGTPWDPAALTAQRHWLTVPWVYDINQ